MNRTVVRNLAITFRQFDANLPLGLVLGIAECGKMFGLMGLIIMCSVHDVSKAGADRRSTSTLRLRCSNGHANVSDGML